MRRVLTDGQLTQAARQAAAAERVARRVWPAAPVTWQPRATAYVPADRYDAETPARWTAEARRLLEHHAPTGAALTERSGVAAAEPGRLHARVAGVLATSALEDVRIDFEDGYGVRDDADEDADAAAAAQAIAAAHASGTLPPRFGLRPKSFADGLAGRCLRTLDLFVCALLDGTGGRLPPGLRVTFPKVVAAAHVAGFASALDRLESALGLTGGTFGVEIQVETPESVVDPAGANALRGIVASGGGRIRAAHLGVFDYTAALGLPPGEQRLDHPACDHARHAMQTALAGTGVELSDGSTNLAPADDSAEEVSRVWRVHAAHVQHSLRHGFVQGWDMHPAHLVSRATAVAGFYLADLDPACERVRAWRDRAAGGTGGVLDEPATVSALLRHLRRAVAAGAVDSAEVADRTGLAAGEFTAPSPHG